MVVLLVFLFRLNCVAFFRSAFLFFSPLINETRCYRAAVRFIQRPETNNSILRNCGFGSLFLAPIPAAPILPGSRPNLAAALIIHASRPNRCIDGRPACISSCSKLATRYMRYHRPPVVDLLQPPFLLPSALLRTLRLCVVLPTLLVIVCQRCW